MAATIAVSLILAPSMFLPIFPPWIGLVLLLPWVLLFVVKSLREQIFGVLDSLRSSLRRKVAVA